MAREGGGEGAPGEGSGGEKGAHHEKGEAAVYRSRRARKHMRYIITSLAIVAPERRDHEKDNTKRNSNLQGAVTVSWDKVWIHV